MGTISHQIDISLLKRLWEQCLTKYTLIKIETIKKEKINKSLTEKYIYEILIREDKQQAELDRKRKIVNLKIGQLRLSNMRKQRKNEEK